VKRTLDLPIWGFQNMYYDDEDSEPESSSSSAPQGSSSGSNKQYKNESKISASYADCRIDD
jgi:hypothetical protein